MAEINTVAVRGAIIDCLEGVITTGRPVPVGEAEADIIDGSDESTKALRALVRPVFTVEFEMDVHPDSPMGPTTIFLWDVAVSIKITYNLKGVEPDSVDYKDRKAIAEGHAVKFAVALGYPGSLVECLTTGEQTGIVSGMLRVRSPLYVVTNDDPEQAIFEVQQNYTAVVRQDVA